MIMAFALMRLRIFPLKAGDPVQEVSHAKAWDNRANSIDFWLSLKSWEPKSPRAWEDCVWEPSRKQVQPSTVLLLLLMLLLLFSSASHHIAWCPLTLKRAIGFTQSTNSMLVTSGNSLTDRPRDDVFQDIWTCFFPSQIWHIKMNHHKSNLVNLAPIHNSQFMANLQIMTIASSQLQLTCYIYAVHTRKCIKFFQNYEVRERKYQRKAEVEIRGKSQSLGGREIFPLTQKFSRLRNLAFSFIKNSKFIFALDWCMN